MFRGNNVKIIIIKVDLKNTKFKNCELLRMNEVKVINSDI